MFRCFLISDFEYDRERHAFEKNFKNLQKKFSDSPVNFNLLVQPYIFSLIPDLIIISNNLIAVADIKSGYGKITGNENSRWFFDNLKINSDRENPFQQIHRYKFALLKFLEKKIHLFFTPEFIDSNLKLGHIKGFVIFDGKIFYNHLQLSETTRKWFKVTSSETFHHDIDKLPKPKINLSDRDIDILIFDIFNLNQSQLIHEYKAETKSVKANVKDDVTTQIKADTITQRAHIPIKINLPANLPNFSKIINYFKYCFVLEDLKSCEISKNSDSFKEIELPFSPFLLKEFTVRLSKELKAFLEKQNYYSKTQHIQLLIAFPVITIRETNIPVFISSLDFTIDNKKNIVTFKILKDFEISKKFISRALGIPDPEQLEEIKSLVDKAKTEEEKINIIFENINPKKAKITKEDFMSAYSSNKVFIFWGNWRTNFKVIKELEELSKKREFQFSPLFHSFLFQTPITNTSSGEPFILPFSKLNKEQLIAVESAFKRPLTVVTGPPGTGKTQVSLNILANAIINGKTVLFSTKNNKAVDDVCKKFNSLFSNLSLSPLLRVGNREVLAHIPDKITQCINILNNFTKISPLEIEKLKNKICFLKDKIKSIESEIERFEQLKFIEKTLKQNEKLSYIKKEIEALSSNIDALHRNLEDYKNWLIEESKKYLLLIYQSLFSSSIIPHLQVFKTAIENQETISISVFTNVLKIFPNFATTNQSTANAIPLEREIFDILIIDEASQSDIASALPLIYRSKNVVIIGDPMQLKHISGLSKEEDITISTDCQIPSDLKLTYSNRSLYSVAEHISNLSFSPVIFLTEHYRSHPDIIKFSNDHFYSHIGRELIVKTPPECLRFTHYQGIFWIHVDGEERDRININEASEIKELLESLILLIGSDISIGVTTPFRNQADFLQTYLHDILCPDIDVVDTIHRFQGDEKDIMFLSLVVSPSSDSSLIYFINQSAKQLLNVAVTRARSCLFVVGNYHFALSKKNTPYDYIFYLAQSSILLY